jgi:hypothetical protein
MKTTIVFVLAIVLLGCVVGVQGATESDGINALFT